VTITAALIKQSADELAYLLTHDGVAGNALVLDNATLAADLIAGPLAEVNGLGVDTREDPNTQAIARRDMLGDGTGATDLTDLPHCECSIQARVAGLVWGVDADEDAVTQRRHELNITTDDAGPVTAILRIKFQHSLTR